jgi:hypothetical protein
MILVRQFAGFKLKRLPGWEKSYLGHIPIVAARI